MCVSSIAALTLSTCPAPLGHAAGRLPWISGRTSPPTTWEAHLFSPLALSACCKNASDHPPSDVGSVILPSVPPRNSLYGHESSVVPIFTPGADACPPPRSG